MATNTINTSQDKPEVDKGTQHKWLRELDGSNGRYFKVCFCRYKISIFPQHEQSILSENNPSE